MVNLTNVRICLHLRAVYTASVLCILQLKYVRLYPPAHMNMHAVHDELAFGLSRQ